MNIHEMNQLSLFQLNFILENKKRYRKQNCKQMLFSKSSHFFNPVPDKVKKLS